MDKKHLLLRHSTWFLHYRLPKKLKESSEFCDHGPIYTKTLKTDNLVLARKRRDAIIRELQSTITGDLDDWARKIVRQSEEFNDHNPDLVGEVTLESLLIESLLDKIGKKDPTAFQQDQLDILAERSGDSS